MVHFLHVLKSNLCLFSSVGCVSPCPACPQQTDLLLELQMNSTMKKIEQEKKRRRRKERPSLTCYLLVAILRIFALVRTKRTTCDNTRSQRWLRAQHRCKRTSFLVFENEVCLIFLTRLEVLRLSASERSTVKISVRKHSLARKEQKLRISL